MVATANTKMNRKDNVEYFSRYNFARRWAGRIEKYILSKTDRLIVSLDRPAIELGMEASYKRFSQYVIQPRAGFAPRPDKQFCRFVSQTTASAWAKMRYIEAAKLHGWPQQSAIHAVSWSIGMTMGCYLALRHYAQRIATTDPVTADLTKIDFNQPCQCVMCQLARSKGGQS
jgi:hypothetical protein